MDLVYYAGIKQNVGGVLHGCLPCATSVDEEKLDGLDSVIGTICF